jgi:ribosomal protein S18 acetylase RimI-like enzyme
LRRSVLRPHETLAQIAADEAAGNLAVGALAGDELVAVGMITPGRGSEGWRVRGMATAPEFRGRGAGGAVLRALVEAAIAGGAERVWCNARTPARTLYERAGFTVVSDEFELPEIGPHYVMERRLG